MFNTVAQDTLFTKSQMAPKLEHTTLDGPLSWGRKLSDFRVIKKRRASAPVTQTKKKRKRVHRRPIPQLACELDEFNQFSETLAANEEAIFSELAGSSGLDGKEHTETPSFAEDEILDDLGDEWLKLQT
jgi:hypothetical protein